MNVLYICCYYCHGIFTILRLKKECMKAYLRETDKYIFITWLWIYGHQIALLPIQSVPN